MKNIIGIGLLVVCFYILGAASQYKLDLWRNPVAESGLPKMELPPVGSALTVERSFEDGTFVGKYAGTRLYYKCPGPSSKVKIILEDNKAYEVVDQAIQNGGHQKMLVPILR